jgi:hypothetical protein
MEEIKQHTNKAFFVHPKAQEFRIKIHNLKQYIEH